MRGLGGFVRAISLGTSARTHSQPDACPSLQNATAELERLEDALNHVKRQLLDQLHDKLRSQIFHTPGATAAPSAPSSMRPSSMKQPAAGKPANGGSSGKGESAVDAAPATAEAPASAEEQQKLLQPLAAQEQRAEHAALGGAKSSSNGAAAPTSATKA